MIKKLIFICAFVAACEDAEKTIKLKCIKVSATAYNSLPYQTRLGSSGTIAAWGDTLRPGMKCIAVSRDLLDSGFTKNTKVLIEGFQGDTFLVLDKMHHRFKKRIDVYIGVDVQLAKQFGFQKRWICLIEEPAVGNE